MKVRELIDALQNMPPELDAVVWLPGSRIDLHALIDYSKQAPKGEVLIEGNLRPGSALS